MHFLIKNWKIFFGPGNQGGKDLLYTFPEKQLMCSKTEFPLLFLAEKMNTTYRNVTTSCGIPFDVAKSALQKYIRRGETQKAVSIGTELCEFSKIPEGKATYTNFLNRLRVIALEDIGIASPETILSVAEHIEKDPLYAIQIMCQTYHSRFYSHVRQGQYEAKHSGHRIPEIKDPELSCEASGLIRACTAKDPHFYYWFDKIMSREKLPQKFERSTRPGFLVFYMLNRLNGSELFKKTLDVCKSWYKILKVRENFLCCLHPIYVYIRGEGKRIIPPATLVGYEKPVLDWYVYDMHTRSGKIYGRNESDFAIEGSLVSFEVVISESLKTHYTDLRLSQGGGARRESEEFTLKCRAQLVTSAHRPDTYFAQCRQTGTPLVVKGPYEFPPQMFAIQAVMGLFADVNTIPNSIKLLIPDLLPGVYGTRKTLDSGKPWYFCVMRDMIGLDEYKTRVHSSKVWPETNIMDTSFFGTDFDFGFPSKMSEPALYSFIVQLAIRKLFGIGDFAARNFLRVKDTVYNLDIEKTSQKSEITPEIRFAQSEMGILKRFLSKNSEKVKNTLKKWKENETALCLAKNVLKLDLEHLIGSLYENPELILC